MDLRDSAGRGELRVDSDLERGAVTTRFPRAFDDTPTTPADTRAEAADADQGGAADTRTTDQGGATKTRIPAQGGELKPVERKKRSRAGKKKQTAKQRLSTHRRWAHARGRRLRKTATSGYVDGLVFDGDIEVCDCAQGAFQAKGISAGYKACISDPLRSERVPSEVEEGVCFVCDATRRGKA